jgi:hypothetical protein
LSVAEEYQKKAFELQKAQLIEATEKERHSTYTTALSTYLPGSFGHAVARLALEMEGGLQLTTTELERVLEHGRNATDGTRHLEGVFARSERDHHWRGSFIPA